MGKHIGFMISMISGVHQDSPHQTQYHPENKTHQAVADMVCGRGDQVTSRGSFGSLLGEEEATGTFWPQGLGVGGLKS